MIKKVCISIFFLTLTTFMLESFIKVHPFSFQKNNNKNKKMKKKEREKSTPILSTLLLRTLWIIRIAGDFFFLLIMEELLWYFSWEEVF